MYIRYSLQCGAKRTRPPRRVAWLRPRGFTIVELLVTIAVIAVLMSILLPALAGSKRAAERTRWLANQREASRTVRVYAGDYEDSFPSWGVPRTNLAPLETDRETYEFFWWAQMDQWGLFLTAVGYDGWLSMGPEAGPGVFTSEATDFGRDTRSSHIMAGAAFAEPVRFSAEQPDTSVLVHTALRYSDVRFPSAKGVLLGPGPPSGGPILVSFADGHSAVHQHDQLPKGVRNMPYGPIPVLTTIDGVLGRDIGPGR